MRDMKVTLNRKNRTGCIFFRRSSLNLSVCAFSTVEGEIAVPSVIFGSNRVTASSPVIEG